MLALNLDSSLFCLFKCRIGAIEAIEIFEDLDKAVATGGYEQSRGPLQGKSVLTVGIHTSTGYVVRLWASRRWCVVVGYSKVRRTVNIGMAVVQMSDEDSVSVAIDRTAVSCLV